MSTKTIRNVRSACCSCGQLQVTTTAEPVRTADSGKTATSTFCPDCGSTVYCELEVLPGFIGVPVGAFADPGFTTPQVSIYEERQHSWVVLSLDIARES